jgi:hypothetical protein
MSGAAPLHAAPAAAPKQSVAARAIARRKCACGASAAAVTGECEACAAGKLQRKASGHTAAAVPPIVHDVLRSPGAPLDAATRAFMEPRFGHDFGAVRVHADARASASARAVDALAYTVGRDVVLDATRVDARTPTGRGVLAHELGHVLQQSFGRRGAGALDLRLENDPRGEREADELARRVIGGKPTPRTPTGTPRSLQRLTAYEFFSNIPVIGAFVKAAIPADFGDDTLLEYLQGIDRRGAIEGDIDSDDKARAVIERWKKDRHFDLTSDRRKFMLLEMLDGPTTLDDERAILDVLETSGNADLRVIFGPGGVDPKQLVEDIDDDGQKVRLGAIFAGRFAKGAEGALGGDRELAQLQWRTMSEAAQQAFVAKHFAAEQEMALKVLKDLLAVTATDVDFEDEQELRNEVSKRVRISGLMQQSQLEGAFGYPELAVPTDPTAPPCPDSKSSYQQNARVNKAARKYWGPVQPHPALFYYFELSADGRANAYEALRTLFTPQANLCDKTLIHCDYLTSVISLRAFAESIGPGAFDERVRSGALRFWLTYHGTRYLIEHGKAGKQPVPLAGPTVGGPIAASSRAVSMQAVRPGSESDLVIGDKVIFWNHLAYDAMVQGAPALIRDYGYQGFPWRLENAVLVDKDASGRDLFEGHGAPVEGGVIKPGPKEWIHRDLVGAYNPLAEKALELTDQIDNGDEAERQDATIKLGRRFPRVTKRGAEWAVRELDTGENARRSKRDHPLRLLAGESDPEIVGLHDPIDPTKMGTVERPVESRKQPLEPT